MSATTSSSPPLENDVLPFAGERLRVLVAQEVAGVGGEVWRDVEGLLGLHAGERVARDVSHRVAARLARDQPGVAEDSHHVGGVGGAG